MANVIYCSGCGLKFDLDDGEHDCSGSPEPEVTESEEEATEDDD